MSITSFKKKIGKTYFSRILLSLKYFLVKMYITYQITYFIIYILLADYYCNRRNYLLPKKKRVSHSKQTNHKTAPPLINTYHCVQAKTFCGTSSGQQQLEIVAGIGRQKLIALHIVEQSGNANELHIPKDEHRHAGRRSLFRLYPVFV